MQGYNAQTAVNEQQIVLAAEITNLSTDFSQLAPMVDATLGELERAGIDQLPEAIAADAGYWNEQQMDEVVADKHIPVLVAPDKGSRGTPKRWLNEKRPSWMLTVLSSEHGRVRYAKRKQTVEPLYGDTKHNKGFIRSPLAASRSLAAISRWIVASSRRLPPLTLLTLVKALQPFSLPLLGRSLPLIGQTLAAIGDLPAMVSGLLALVRDPIALGHRTLTLLGLT